MGNSPCTRAFAAGILILCINKSHNVEISSFFFFALNLNLNLNSFLVKHQIDNPSSGVVTGGN